MTSVAGSVQQLNNDYMPTDPMDNPIGTDGFEFVMYTGPNIDDLKNLFETMGFTATAKHRTKNVFLYQQGQTNFIIDGEAGHHSTRFASKHGPSAPAMGFRVENAQTAYQKLIDRGASPYEQDDKTLNVPAIKGIGGSLIYLIDAYEDGQVYKENDFVPLSSQPIAGVGITYIDHLTHNVYQGNMDEWARFYIDLFNFRQIRFFDIDGQQTGLLSRAMSSPCNKIRIPLNESKDDKSQIEEYLNQYNGEGIQHIAFCTDDIYETVEAMRRRNIKFMTLPDTYYELLETRLPGHNEDFERLKKTRILVDGEMDQPGKPLLLQIFTRTLIGPIFFEVIQRKGHEGFGEGNFGALFEAMELDQKRRGVL
jgi:4-hydroxyphenylpyruvate dioxygenase